MPTPAFSYDPVTDNGLQLPPMLAVVGPTASGKSELAVELAERLGGEVINTDSLQLYRYLDIGTAKPEPALRERVPHHLIDLLEPDEHFSAGRFVSEARRVIGHLTKTGRVAVLCGGTGLYFKSLVFGLADIPKVPPEVRARVEELINHQGVVASHQELLRLDPDYGARLHENDRARVQRALEVVLATGKSLATFQGRQPFQEQAQGVCFVAYQWERAALYDRINQRAEAMLAAGLEEEVARVLAMGFSPSIKPLQAIGYREVVAVLQKSLERGGLAEAIAQRTRNYAKRQLTWLRKTPDVHWLPPGDITGALTVAENFLNSKR